MKKRFGTFAIALIACAGFLTACTSSSPPINVESIVNANQKTGSFAIATIEETFDEANIADTAWAITSIGADYKSGEVEWDVFGPNYIELNASNYVQGARYAYTRDTLSVQAGDSVDISFLAHYTNNPTKLKVMYSTNDRYTWTDVETFTLDSFPDTDCESKIEFTSAGDVVIGLQLLAVDAGKTQYAKIDDITVVHSRSMPSFTAGASLTLTSTVLPNNATNRTVSYEIVTAETTAAGASVSGDVVTATGKGVIKLIPKTSSFNGTPFFVAVV